MSFFLCVEGVLYLILGHVCLKKLTLAVNLACCGDRFFHLLIQLHATLLRGREKKDNLLILLKATLSRSGCTHWQVVEMVLN